MYEEQFPINLKNARIKSKRTQKEVSEILDVHRSTIACYEIGKTQPDIETLGKLADLYDVSLDWLLGTKSNDRFVKENWSLLIDTGLAEAIYESAERIVKQATRNRSTPQE